MATALQRERKTVEILRGALAETEAERIALADSFRETLESVGFQPTTAALLVQGVIDKARADHAQAQKGS